MTPAQDIRVLTRRESALVMFCRALGCGLGAFVGGLTLAQPRSILVMIMLTSVSGVGMALSTALVLWLRRSHDPVLVGLLEHTLLWSCCSSGLPIVFSLWADQPWLQYLLMQGGFTLGSGLILCISARPGWMRRAWYGVNTAALALAASGALLLRQSQPDSGSVPSLLAVAGLLALVYGLAPALLLLRGGVVETAPQTFGTPHQIFQARWLRQRLLVIGMNASGFAMTIGFN